MGFVIAILNENNKSSPGGDDLGMGFVIAILKIR